MMTSPFYIMVLPMGWGLVIEQTRQVSFFVTPFLLASDVNECMEGTDNCHTNADCTDTVGSFQCTCSPGYSGDGIENCTGQIPMSCTQCHATNNIVLSLSFQMLTNAVKAPSSVILMHSALTPSDSTLALVDSATRGMATHV